MKGEITYAISVADAKDARVFNNFLKSIACRESQGVSFVWYCPKCKRYYSHELIQKQKMDQPKCDCGALLGQQMVVPPPNWESDDIVGILGDAAEMVLSNAVELSDE